MGAARVLVFVDEANFASLCYERNREPDWVKLRNWLANPDEDRSLVEMVIYVGTAPNIPDVQEFQDERAKVASRVRRYEYDNFMVMVKEGKPNEDRPKGYEANVDVLMAMDAATLAADIRPDVVVLVTGDADFAHLAQYLRRKGVHVEVASVENTLGDALERSVNRFLDLASLIDSFEPARAG